MCDSNISSFEVSFCQKSKLESFSAECACDQSNPSIIFFHFPLIRPVTVYARKSVRKLRSTAVIVSKVITMKYRVITRNCTAVRKFDRKWLFRDFKAIAIFSARANRMLIDTLNEHNLLIAALITFVGSR